MTNFRLVTPNVNGTQYNISQNGEGMYAVTLGSASPDGQALAYCHTYAGALGYIQGTSIPVQQIPTYTNSQSYFDIMKNRQYTGW